MKSPVLPETHLLSRRTFGVSNQAPGFRLEPTEHLKPAKGRSMLTPRKVTWTASSSTVKRSTSAPTQPRGKYWAWNGEGDRCSYLRSMKTQTSSRPHQLHPVPIFPRLLGPIPTPLRNSDVYRTSRKRLYENGIAGNVSFLFVLVSFSRENHTFKLGVRRGQVGPHKKGLEEDEVHGTPPCLLG